MNQNTSKIFIYSFVGIFILEIVFMVYLHRQMVNQKILNDFESLMASGAEHRDALSEKYSPIKIHQLIAENKEQEIFITNLNGYVLNNAENIKVLNNNLPLVQDLDTKKDQLVIDNWKDAPYIASAHYFENGQISGFVVMFQSTSPIHEMIQFMNICSIIAIATSLIFLAMVYSILIKIQSLQKRSEKITFQYSNA
ncbi:hypothetical protein [Lysinibacillus sp. BW-2-10]|uniref:hypothetical protein n=1 Tax=Lysinibacillus sp. BW-2-10 TaxID=2590030 RepID=UPI00117DC2D9|nr:hypothetical protein [Lysinibacillus sp. BW-2-10]TSI11753.1 hypothetical protein FJQ64_00080 [Lysinibacillus sp. BW-2-10]